jgi:hypothetical protein
MRADRGGLEQAGVLVGGSAGVRGWKRGEEFGICGC